MHAAAPAVLSRGLQLEAAVDRLPDWYFTSQPTQAAQNQTPPYSPHDLSELDELDADFRAYYGDAGGRAQYDDLEFGRTDALGSVDELTGGSGVSDPDDRPAAAATAFRAPHPEAALLASLTLELLVKQQREAERRIRAQQTAATAAASTSPPDRNQIADGSNQIADDRNQSADEQRHAEGDNQDDDDGNDDLLAGKTLRAASGPETQTQIRSASSRRSTDSSSGSYADLRISGFSMRARERSVMYHVDVLHCESQLQTYTIRRSYSDFKELHAQLDEILDARQQYYRSRALSRQARQDRERSAAAGASSLSSLSTINHPGEEAQERAIMAFALPALPHAGLLSFWKRHDRAHLQSRCQSFQELLHAVLDQPFLRESFATQKFLSVAPCAIRERGSSYVSLCEYSVPQIDRQEEHRERRRRAQQYRRNSSASAGAASMLVEY